METNTTAARTASEIFVNARRPIRGKERIVCTVTYVGYPCGVVMEDEFAFHSDDVATARAYARARLDDINLAGVDWSVRLRRVGATR
jgi:hypothetical protein